MRRVYRTSIASLAMIASSVWGQSGSEDPSAQSVNSGILLANASIEPTMTIRWTSNQGPRELSGSLPYGPPSGGEILEGSREDGNIRAYLAIGGTRVETGAGHPKGLVIRAGLTKVESARQFFQDIAPGTSIEIELEGVVLQSEIKYHEGTGIMHLKYAIGDLLACSLPGTARNQYLLSDPKDTLGGRVVAGLNATPGALDGSEDHGSINFTIDDQDASKISMQFVVPYAMLRHLQDPWNSTLPGTFFEPIHLHAEVEVIPINVEPFDREWILESNEPVSSDEASEEMQATDQDD